MTATDGTVFLLDDEPGMLKALTRLLKAEGFTVSAFTSAKTFLDSHHPEPLSCLVLDVAMPELNGLELQQRLTRAGDLLPIVLPHRARRYPDERAGHQGRRPGSSHQTRQ